MSVACAPADDGPETAAEEAGAAGDSARRRSSLLGMLVKAKTQANALRGIGHTARVRLEQELARACRDLEAQQQSHRGGGQSASTADVTAKSRQGVTDARQDGCIEFHTPANQRKRSNLIAEPGIDSALNRWLVSTARELQRESGGGGDGSRGTSDDGGGGIALSPGSAQARAIIAKNDAASQIGFATYKKLYGRLAPVFANSSELDAGELQGAAYETALRADWDADRRGCDALTPHLFKRSVFQLADMWVDSLVPRDYVAFLDKLHDTVFCTTASKRAPQKVHWWNRLQADVTMNMVLRDCATKMTKSSWRTQRKGRVAALSNPLVRRSDCAIM